MMMRPCRNSFFTPGRFLVLTFLLGTAVCLFAPEADAAAGRDYTPARAPSRQQVYQMVIDEARRQGFPPELALAVAKAESGFQAHAESPVGARGVMQIMPRTGRTVLGLQPDELWDARTNIRGGIRFLKYLVRTYDGRVDIALSHYNGGSAVRRKNGSLRIIPATRSYVKKVRQLERQYRRDRHDSTSRDTGIQVVQSRDAVIIRASRNKPLDHLRRKSAKTGYRLDRLDHQLGRISRLLANSAGTRPRKSELHEW